MNTTKVRCDQIMNGYFASSHYAKNQEKMQVCVKSLSTFNSVYVCIACIVL